MNATLPAPILDAEHHAAIEKLAQGLDPIALSWAAGYLAGLSRARAGGPLSQAAPAAAPIAEARAEGAVRATILYASQTGNGRRVAEKLARSAEASGLAVRLVSAADFAPRELANERLLFLVASTHGDGDPPDDARALIDHIASKRAPRLERLAFSVLALGDSSYPKYCETGRQIDARLAALGARRLAPLQECDVDFEADAGAWSERSLAFAREQLAEIGGPRLAVVTPLRPAAAEASRERPVEVELLASQRITGRGSPREVRHLEIAAPAGRLDYEPGDALGIVHRNPAVAVEGVLRAAGLDGASSVEHDGRSQPLAAWLQADREITKLSRPFLEAQARLAGADELAAALQPSGAAQLRGLLKDWQVADVLKRWPAAWSPAALVGALRPLAPRLYSIASSRLAVGDEAHLTVAIVDYERDGEHRVGSASTFLAGRVAESDTVQAYIERNPRFRLPADGQRDVVMIGPGTGVAPFRGFLQHREESGATGRNWLFFGARHFDDEFLYQAEWLAALKRGSLHRLDVAFSRDQPRRIYVQQRMAEQGAELFRWIDGGAHLYVCGDAQQMAPDVHAALIEVVRVHGVRDLEAARAYVDQLLTERRYARDTY